MCRTQGLRSRGGVQIPGLASDDYQGYFISPAARSVRCVSAAATGSPALQKPRIERNRRGVCFVGPDQAVALVDRSTLVFEPSVTLHGTIAFAHTEPEVRGKTETKEQGPQRQRPHQACTSDACVAPDHPLSAMAARDQLFRARSPRTGFAAGCPRAKVSLSSGDTNDSKSRCNGNG